MELSPGFNQDIKKGMVCRLKKSLYGLNQSTRAWFVRFANVVRRLGYTQAHTYHMLFYKHEKKTIFIVYVDDMIFISS